MKWARIVYWHWLIALLLAIKAAIVTADVWGITAGWQLWHVALGAASATVALSAIAPLDRRLQTVAMYALMFVSVSRTATYLGVIIMPTTRNVDLLAGAFAVHWTIFTLIALRWAALSEPAGRRLTLAAEADHGRA
jgi:hypothetical protein